MLTQWEPQVKRILEFCMALATLLPTELASWWTEEGIGIQKVTLSAQNPATLGNTLLHVPSTVVLCHCTHGITEFGVIPISGVTICQERLEICLK